MADDQENTGLSEDDLIDDAEIDTLIRDSISQAGIVVRFVQVCDVIMTALLHC